MAATPRKRAYCARPDHSLRLSTAILEGISGPLTARSNCRGMSLSQTLLELSRHHMAALSPRDRADVEDELNRLRMLRVAEEGLRVGDHLPDFALQDGSGRLWTSGELLDRGPLVLALFRGDWCPYCELTMAALEQARPAIEALGATAVGVMPGERAHRLRLRRRRSRAVARSRSAARLARRAQPCPWAIETLGSRHFIGAATARRVRPRHSGRAHMLQGKTAIVTGSTSGIGLGIAEALARAGANVVLNGFGEAMQIEKTRAELAHRTNARIVYSPADMGKPRAIEHMVREAVDTFGGVDVMVNNAGIQHVAPIDEFPEDKWDAIVAINLSSAFHATKLVLPQMRRKGWGRVINVASAHALVASPYKAAYVAAKHGVLGLTKVTALETAGDGITCNAICPGYVRTLLVEQQIDDQARAHGIPRDQVVSDALLKEQPNKRFVEVAELAALALFLCSDNGASVTGAALPMDGGWTAY